MFSFEIIDKWSSSGRALLAVSIALIALSGCAHMKSGQEENQLVEIVALPNTETAALSAIDVVNVMRVGGFSDDVILRCGRELRNKMAQNGAIYIRLNGRAELIVAVRNELLHLSSRSRGSFLYSYKTHEFQ